MLQRMIYFSRSRIQGPPEHVMEEVQHILAAAQKNNALCDVTGALLFNSGGFAQVLEGERGQVAAVFERIQRDARHSDVLVLEYAKVDQRRFANWSMRSPGQNRRDERLFGAISDQSGFDARSLSSEDIFSAMHRLVLEEELAL